jgi:hypothetical protein
VPRNADDVTVPDYVAEIIRRLADHEPITQDVLDRVPADTVVQFPAPGDVTVIIKHGTLNAYRRGEWPS